MNIPNDSVLRCLVTSPDKEISIVDTVDFDSEWRLVIKWGKAVGHEGEFPMHYIDVPKEDIGVVESEISDYELVLKLPLDIKSLRFEDVNLDNEEPEFFQPTPEA